MAPTFDCLLQIDQDRLGQWTPFSFEPVTWDLTHDCDLSSGRDKRFYAAITGSFNDTGIAPLYPCRGLPEIGCDDDDYKYGKTWQHMRDEQDVGWLTLSEIHAALAHMRIDPKELSHAIRMLLGTMQCAEEIYGKDRVRLVFHLW